MLKKLVRYGNSNALVLDKAILELLNIAEGSVVKISTDGRSIILTPHEKPVTQQVSQTLTSSETLNLVGIRQSLNVYPTLSPEQKNMLEKEWVALCDKNISLNEELLKNEQFVKESALIAKQCGGNVELIVQERNKLLAKYKPELLAVQDAMKSFDLHCKEVAGVQKPENFETAQEQMSKDFAEVFAKHKDTQMAFTVSMNSPEYQHKAQLLTEKYEGNQRSEEFVKEMQQLMYEFCPEMEALHQEIAAVSKKYNPTH